MSPDRPDWLEGSFRFDSYDRALSELLSLRADVEVLLPVELRDAMARTCLAIAALPGERRVTGKGGPDRSRS